MGRGKLKMELMKNEKSRNITYHKRKKGLLKKAREFHILCEVDVCVIIFGPKLSNNRPIDVETWPASHDPGLIRIISGFKEKVNDQRKKIQDLSDFFASRKKKVDEEIAKSRKAYVGTKFPTWDDRLNHLSIEQLRLLENVIDNKLEAAKARLLKMKSEQWLVGECKSLATKGTTTNSSTANNISRLVPNSINHGSASVQKDPELNILDSYIQPSHSLKSLDIQLPTFYTPQEPPVLPMMPSFNVSSPMLMMMMMNSEDYVGVSSNNRINPCHPPVNVPMNYYDPTFDMLGSVTFPSNSNTNHASHSNLLPCYSWSKQSLMPIPQISYFGDSNNFGLVEKKDFRFS